VLKNFPTEAELEALPDGTAAGAQYWRGEHFWALRYEVVRR
jgi:hypothetical protein